MTLFKSLVTAAVDTATAILPAFASIGLRASAPMPWHITADLGGMRSREVLGGKTEGPEARQTRVAEG